MAAPVDLRCETPAAPSPVRQGQEDSNDQDRDRSFLLQQALSQLPPQQVADYAKALATAPEVVKTESPWDAYVESHGKRQNAELATERLTSYWTERVKAFGDRAFLPLCEALTGDDHKVLHTGYLTLLPKTSTDHNKCVLHLEPDRLQGLGSNLLDLVHRRRVLFYMMHQIRLSLSTESSMILLLSVSSTSVFGENVKRIGRILQCAPFLVEGLHLCGTTCGNSSDNQHFAGSVTAQLMKFSSQLQPPLVRVHISHSKAGIAKNLAAFGFTDLQALPVACGGTYVHQHEDEQTKGLVEAPAAALKPAKRARTQGPTKLAPLEASLVDARAVLDKQGPPKTQVISPKVQSLLDAVKGLQRQSNTTTSVSSILKRTDVQRYLKTALSKKTPATANTSTGASGSAIPSVVSTESSPARAAKVAPRLKTEGAALKSELKTRILESMLANLKNKNPSVVEQQHQQQSPVRQALVSQILRNLKQKARPQGVERRG